MLGFLWKFSTSGRVRAVDPEIALVLITTVFPWKIAEMGLLTDPVELPFFSKATSENN